jgi:transglutaminase-like putative cysteine protease
MSKTELESFLRSTRVVDWQNPRVFARAEQLANGRSGDIDVARACFEWVRDEIPHTLDHELDPITCSASEVLALGTGVCYAKSHLLAALLRANGIPCGFVYQRLRSDDLGGSFCLHGLNALWLPGVGWYRVDGRGNRPALPQAEFLPPCEILPFGATGEGEMSFPGIWAEPVGVVVRALATHRDRRALLANLPDAVVLEDADVDRAP